MKYHHTFDRLGNPVYRKRWAPRAGWPATIGFIGFALLVKGALWMMS